MFFKLNKGKYEEQFAYNAILILVSSKKAFKTVIELLIFFTYDDILFFTNISKKLFLCLFVRFPVWFS